MTMNVVWLPLRNTTIRYASRRRPLQRSVEGLRITWLGSGRSYSTTPRRYINNSPNPSTQQQQQQQQQQQATNQQEQQLRQSSAAGTENKKETSEELLLFLADTKIHVRGESNYGSREYVLLPAQVPLAEACAQTNIVATIRAHRNIIFAAQSVLSNPNTSSNHPLIMSLLQQSPNTPIHCDRDDAGDDDNDHDSGSNNANSIDHSSSSNNNNNNNNKKQSNTSVGRVILPLATVCEPLFQVAFNDCSMQGDQVQAISTLHGLSAWIRSNLEQLLLLHHPNKMDETAPRTIPDSASTPIDDGHHNLDVIISQRLIHLQEHDPKGFEAVQAIATEKPRQGHSVIGQGTFRDAERGWRQLATEFVQLGLGDEALLYQQHGGQLISIEHLAETRTDYLKSAGGAMARFAFL